MSFEDMEVFQRAYRVSLEIHRVSLTFPAVEQRALADQIRRASKSICANLAEGYGRQKGSKAEFARFVRMAIGSSDEMRVWLRYAFDLGYVDEPTWRGWRDEYQVSRGCCRALPTRSDIRSRLYPSSVVRLLSSGAVAERSVGR